MAGATSISFRKGDRTAHENFRGVEGEITVQTGTQDNPITVWVHPGNDMQGSPLAREDLANVTQQSIANKNIAKSDLSNIEITASTDYVKNQFSLLGYANKTGDNLSTTALTDPEQHAPGLGPVLARQDMYNVDTEKLAQNGADASVAERWHIGKNLAYADLENVEAQNVADKLGTEYFVKTNGSNVNTAIFAETASGHSGKNLSYADLSNIELTDATKQTMFSAGIQLTENLATSLEDVDDITYPSTQAVKNAINNAVFDLTLPDYPETTANTLFLGATAIKSAYTYKGSVATLSYLPETNNNVNDVYKVTDVNKYYAWNNSAWVELSTEEAAEVNETGINTDFTPAWQTTITSDYINFDNPEEIIVSPGTATPVTNVRDALIALAQNQEGATELESNLREHLEDLNNPHQVTKAQVGLGNVNNTSDANKPISTATQTALNGKLSLTGGTMSGTITSETGTENPAIKTTDDGGQLWLKPSSDVTYNGGFILRGKNNSDGSFADLRGKSDGTLTWNGAKVLTNEYYGTNSSDSIRLYSGGSNNFEGAELHLSGANAVGHGGFTIQAATSLTEYKQLCGFADGRLKWNNIDISAMSMPSKTYVDLTEPALSEYYQAPADGWVVYQRRSDAAGQYIQLAAGTVNDTTGFANSICRSTAGSQQLAVTVPVQKDWRFFVRRTAKGSFDIFRFVYAEGAKHLATE